MTSFAALIHPVDQTLHQPAEHTAVDAEHHLAVPTGPDHQWSNPGRKTLTVAAALGDHPGVVPPQGRCHSQAHHRLMRGNIHVLPLAGAVSLLQRKQGANRTVQTRLQPDLLDPHAQRRPVDVATLVHDPAQRPEHQIRCLQVTVGAGLSERRDRDMDERRIERLQRLIPQPQALEVSDGVRFDEEVGTLQQLPQLITPLGCLDIERDAALARVECMPWQALFRIGNTLKKGTHRPRGVTSRLLHLDDVCAEIGQELSTEHSGRAAEIDAPVREQRRCSVLHRRLRLSVHPRAGLSTLAPKNVTGRPSPQRGGT